jgi:predicted dehydrogenase
MIHDIGTLHGLFGAPRRVVNTEIWADGAALTTTLEYDGDRRCVVDRVDLPDVWDWEETLGVYGSRERVIVSFPHGLSRGLPTTVAVHGAEADGQAWRKELSWHDVAFTLELRHFAECIREGRAPLTPGRQAIADMALVRDVILAYLRGQAAGEDSRPAAASARAIT